jgi:hypothetical protein
VLDPGNLMASDGCAFRHLARSHPSTCRTMSATLSTLLAAQVPRAFGVRAAAPSA